MHIISQGLGWIAAVIIFGFSLIANLAFDAACGQGYYDHHLWPFAISLLFSAVLCWFLGLRLKNRSDRVVIDKQTGEEFVVNQSKHTLFFVPMHLWGPLLIAISILILASQLHWK